MLRFAIATFLLGLGLGLGGCGGEEAADSGLALRDPAALIDQVEGELRLVVLPSDMFTCDSATGFTSPNPPEERGAMIPEAIFTNDFSTADLVAGVMAMVPPGEWVILVRGWGTDEVSGRTDFLIATGCATDEVPAGGTRNVEIELIQNFGAGVCGDDILSPDEQCDDGNTTAGDGCDDACRTESFLVSRTAGMEAAEESLPGAAWVEGSRLAISYTSDVDSTPDARTIYLSESGAVIESPTAFAVDASVEEMGGVQTVTAVATNGSRYGFAYASFLPGMTTQGVRVRFLNADRVPEAAAVQANDAPTLMETDPAIAMMPDGTTLVVFTNPSSATGLTGRLFGAGSATPTAAPFPAGTGQAGGATPGVAASSTGFVVVFAAGGSVFYQRYGADGAAVDPMAVNVGSGDAPTVASLADGRTAIAWAAGFGVQAQVYDAMMMPVGGVLDVGAGSAPTLAASRDRFAVAYLEGSGIMARMISPDGVFALNRDAPPSTDAFPVASGSVTAPAAAAGGTSAAPAWFVTWQDNATDPAGDIHGRLFPLP